MGGKGGDRAGLITDMSIYCKGRFGEDCIAKWSLSGHAMSESGLQKGCVRIPEP